MRHSKNRVLRVDSSARGAESNSYRITDYLWQRLQQLGAEPVAHHNLGAQPLPAISGEDLVAVHASGNSDRDSLQQHLDLSRRLIDEIKAADSLIIGAPLYNFGIPATLKQWIDYIARAGETFRYTADGPEGLSGVSEAFVVVATGGTPVGSEREHASRYLRTVLQFIGVETVHIIDAAGSKGSPEEVISRARAQVDSIFAERQVA